MHQQRIKQQIKQQQTKRIKQQRIKQQRIKIKQQRIKQQQIKQPLKQPLNQPSKQQLLKHQLLKQPGIPLHIYQVWHSSELPNSVKECIDNIKSTNPEFTHHLYNMDDCRQFIVDNFSTETVDAFDSLVPHAYKIDLFRYCMMYQCGGIYLDSKLYCVNDFKFIYLTDSEYFCEDIKGMNPPGIYNAILVCKPYNNIMLKAINKILYNVKNKYYGDCGLEPTGPKMLGSFFSNNELQQLILHNEYDADIGGPSHIKFDILPILRIHPKYREECKLLNHTHWSDYWKNKTAYL
jgi:mannosyltransferase OCH1-like enzyme